MILLIYTNIYNYYMHDTNHSLKRYWNVNDILVHHEINIKKKQIYNSKLFSYPFEKFRRNICITSMFLKNNEETFLIFPY